MLVSTVSVHTTRVSTLQRCVYSMFDPWSSIIRSNLRAYTSRAPSTLCCPETCTCKLFSSAVFFVYVIPGLRLKGVHQLAIPEMFGDSLNNQHDAKFVAPRRTLRFGLSHFCTGLALPATCSSPSRCIDMVYDFLGQE